MADRFLAEVRAMHKLRADMRALSDEAREAYMQRMPHTAGDWVFHARDAQLPPPDLDWCWLLLGGRGFGKSHSLAAAVHIAVRAGISRIIHISPSISDTHEIAIDGRSGIFATCGRDPRPRFVASRRRMEWPNGAVCMFFSGEEPDSLRGHQCELCLIDEIGRMRYQQATFDMSMMTLRLGDKPRIMLATTPRNTPLMKRLVSMDNIRITTGSTYDNAVNLAPDFLAKIKELYEGTRLGRQELAGQMVLDPANALFKDDWLIHDDVAEDRIEQVSVGVDPSGGGDEVGIIVGALLTNGQLAILADRTLAGSPAQWGEAAVKAHDSYDADDLVAEINFGGTMVEEVIKRSAERLHERGERESSYISVKEVSASRGKVMRAEPISLLYEKGRVLHRRGLDQLEGEMMSFSRDWDRAVDGSPNRLDAMVWVATRLSKVVTELAIA